MPVRTEVPSVGYDFLPSDHDTELEMYPTSSASHPSEDIWKKFELIPTPPSSPQRDDTNYWDDTEAKRHKLVASLVDGPSDDDFLSQSLVLGDFEFAGLSKNLQANVIKDCMWTCKRETPCHPHDTKLATKFTFRSRRSDSESSCTSIREDSSDCVDPLAVFPYSVSRDISSRDSLGTETPSDSEEEIDVVTVEKKILPPVKKRTHPTPEAIKQALAEHREMHNYTRPCPPQSHVKVTQGRIAINGIKRPSSSASNSAHMSKKLKRDINISDLKSAVKRLQGGYSSGSSLSSSRSSSRASSDSEDCERRSQHNVLERKRRNDLKSSFLGLRDMIPNLSQSERAPKVVILKKAAEYVSSLARTESKLKAELRSEELRKEQLLKRLQYLQRNSENVWDY